jgi:hypothetical protein
MERGKGEGGERNGGIVPRTPRSGRARRGGVLRFVVHPPYSGNESN